MTYAASEFVQRFMDATADPTNVRWTAPEVIRYANDGQRDIAMHRPDAFTTNEIFTCASGAKQTLPAGATKLISIFSNGAAGRVVTPIKREMLDASTPLWPATTASATIYHTMYDERDPLVFYTYPPATTAATLRMQYAIAPTDIPTPTTNFLAGVTGNLSVGDLFVNALLDYVLFRAYSKEAEVGNPERANQALARYAGSLGIEIRATLAMSPNQNSPLNPAMPASATKPMS